MSVRIDSLTHFADLGFDEIIDARSPAEYAEDHVPGAINLPSLDNEERARVGTIYVQDEPFAARKIGAALVARNVARHLEGPLADKNGSWRPLVYCWRGGQRSNAFASILSQIGWRAEVLEGGYRSYRRLVNAMLYDTPLPHRFVLIDGGTGTAKTRLLHEIAALGGQTLDLEGLAHHRGSLFGLVGGEQPAQKGFESAIAGVLTKADPTRPTFVEAESSKIGQLIIAPSLWKAMTASPYVDVSAPLSERARHLVDTYPDIVSNTERLSDTLSQLARYHGHAQVDAWRDLAAHGAWTDLAETLIAHHYDRSYKRIRGDHPPDLSLNLDNLSDDTLADAATRLVAHFDA